MDMRMIVWAMCAVSTVALLSIIALLGRLKRIREQLQDMQGILDDIQRGNGNRRILIPESNVTAPLAYRMNEIVSHYEERLVKLRKNDEANRQLMTSLSHDVRTPLTTLIGYLDAAHRGMVTGSEREEAIGIADRKAHDLKEYIDVLFDWFKLNSDDFALSMEPVEIGELTRNILKDWIPVFEEKGLDYEIEIPARRLAVQLDADAYLRIVNNLVQNVIFHSHAERVGIRILIMDGKKNCNKYFNGKNHNDECEEEKRNGSEEYDDKQHNREEESGEREREKNDRNISGTRNAVAVCVYDNGVGIEDADLKHIFERLYKCDKGRSGKGSGLGLSIVRQMVGKMGGTVSVQSEKGKYCEFRVEFPLAEG